jgi:hypothetical protein
MNAKLTGGCQLRKELFQPTVEGEARLLLLIDAFSSNDNALEGRTKLAKLDFFLRYPLFLKRALLIRKPDIKIDVTATETDNIENRMVRYRYGPWDPAYFALLGRLIGKHLIQVIPTSRGFSYKTTDLGHSLAQKLAKHDSWVDIAQRTLLLKKHLNLKGSNLKDFIYQNFPEVSEATWGDRI